MMNGSAIRCAVILAAAAPMALKTTAATAQQPPVYQTPQTVASQIVWTPTYYYDAAGALWLVYVPTTQAAAPAQAQAAAPAQTRRPGIQAPRSMVSPHAPELGTGRNVRMHKPWMSGRR